jgi:V/A-type H+-transporting ATPase subunit C
MADVSSIISFGGMQVDVVPLVIVAAAAASVFVIVLTMKEALGSAPFSYPTARVMARRGRLLSEKQLIDVVEAKKLDDIYNTVGEVTEYKNYLDKYPFQKAMDMQLAETHAFLEKVAPDKFKAFFRVLLSRWDVRNIKTIITAKVMGLDIEDLRDMIIPFGNLKEDFMTRLVETESLEELITELKETEYSDIIDDAMSDFKETKVILPFEANLDKYFYEEWSETVSDTLDDDLSVLGSFVNVQIDVINLKIILRSRLDGLEYNDIKDFLINGGNQLSQWKLKDLMNNEKISEIINSLEGTDYIDVMRDIVPQYEKTNSISPFELALDKYVMEKGRKLGKKRPTTIGPIFDFLCRKKIEIKNLKTIFQGKKEGFPPEKIKKMLIGVQT